MTDVDVLSDRIVQSFEAWVKGLFKRLTAAPETPLPVLLDEVRHGLRPILRAVVLAASRCVGQYQTAPTCGACGCRLWSKGFRSHYVTSELGETQVVVRRWRCPQCAGEQQPWWAEAGLERGWTAGMWQVAKDLVVSLPFRAVEGLLQRLGCPVSDTTLQAWAIADGRRLAAEQEREAREWEGLERRLPVELTAERVYTLADGCMANTIEGGWQEVKVGVVFGTAAAPSDEGGRPPAAEWKRVVATVAQSQGDEVQADSFARLLGAEMVRCGIWEAQEAVVAGDGAEWLWARLPGLVPMHLPSEEILDFYHAAEHVATAARAAYAEDETAYQACYRRLRGHLKLGNIGRLLAELEALAARAADAEGRAVLERERRYLAKHRQRMGYLRLRLTGHHLGTGAVESACKQLLCRVRGPGMRWRTANLEAMLALRAEFLSDEGERQTVREAV